MARKRRGQILLYRRAVRKQEPLLRAWRLQFHCLNEIAIEMRGRRDLLAEALEREDPGALPQCEWHGKGCDYGEVCGCDGAAPGERLVPEAGYEAREDPDLAQSLLAKLNGHEPGQEFGVHDLVFPRRSLLERQAREDRETEEDGERILVSMERRGFQLALLDALRYGAPGAFKGVPVRLRSLKGIVRTYRGRPRVFRSSRFREMVERDRLAYAQPHSGGAFDGTPTTTRMSVICPRRTASSA